MNSPEKSVEKEKYDQVFKGWEEFKGVERGKEHSRIGNCEKRYKNRKIQVR